MLATVYVYPAGKVGSSAFSSPQTVAVARGLLFLADFDGSKKAITTVTSKAKVFEEKPVTLSPAAARRTGRMAVFEGLVDDQGQEQDSRLYLFCDIDNSDGWLVKYRFSYPRAIDATKTIDEFMLAAPWGAGGLLIHGIASLSQEFKCDPSLALSCSLSALRAALGLAFAS